jgi:hypothetical protein
MVGSFVLESTEQVRLAARLGYDVDMKERRAEEEGNRAMERDEVLVTRVYRPPCRNC